MTTSVDATSVREQVAAAARRLDDAGVPSARHDAEALAAHLLGVPRTALLLAEGPLDAASYATLVARRAAREPLQHLVGTAPFRHLELLVGPGVFVPRPETEAVVDAALAAIAEITEPLVVDLCAGSGAIALSIKHERADAQVHAVELSDDAMLWLLRNVFGLELVVRGVQGDVRDPALLAELDGTVDLVVSNPPYIPEGAVPLDPEVRDHDPALALFGGPDGLDVVRAVAVTARRLLRPGGVLVIEHSDRDGAVAPEVLRGHGFVDVSDHRDLAGRDRYVVGSKP